MKMRVVKAFGMYSVGAIIEPHGMYREQLRQGGFVEPVPTAAAQPEVALAVEPETASLPTPKRRGRPPRVAH